MRYTHRLRVGKVQLEHRYGMDIKGLEKYYKDGYLYGYYADGVLLGDLVEITSEYVAFEWWLRVETESRIKEVKLTD